MHDTLNLLPIVALETIRHLERFNKTCLHLREAGAKLPKRKLEGIAALCRGLTTRATEGAVAGNGYSIY